MTDEKITARRLLLESMGWKFWRVEADECALLWRALVPKRKPYRDGTVMHSKTEEMSVSWAWNIAVQFDQLSPEGDLQ